MKEALKGVPVQEIEPPPGVMRVGGDWYYEEFGPSRGVQGLGLQDPWPGAIPEGEAWGAEAITPPTTEDRRSILDLFRN